jgi:hypothetical protein
MKRKHIFMLGIVFAVLMQTVVLALMPPAVVQNIEMYDTLSLNNESGCRYCHASGVPNTHHDLVAAGKYSCENCHPVRLDGNGTALVRDCLQCHNNTFNGMNIKRPHHDSPEALNGNCKKCHASLATGSDVIVPTIYSVSTDKVLEGESKTLTIHGENFITTVDGITRSSVVTVTGETSNITITPNNVSSNDINVTLPPLSKGLYGIRVHKEGNVESNALPLVSAQNVVINSVRKVFTSVTITGSGFGVYDPVYYNFVNVEIKKENVSRPVQIISWSDRSITVTSPKSNTGDVVTVNGIYGANWSLITN